MAVVTAKTPPGAPPYRTSAVTNGYTPQATPVGAAPQAASGALALSADPTGLLAYNTKTLTASAGKVTIDFTNKSPLSHNVTIANAAGKVLGQTATFQGGTKTLSLNLPPGTYTFYCSVPGHRQAGMEGTLKVS
jgi:plastocyanin